MESHHRKVDLQAPADLEYLTAIISDVAQQKIDLHLPPSATDNDDAFRTSVNDQVHEYVKETLHLALPSVSINGIDATTSQLRLPSDTTVPKEGEDDVYEPYDPKLASHLRDLYAQLETENTKVAELRRDAPPKAAERYLTQLNEEIAQRREEFVARQKELDSAVAAPTGLEGFKFDRSDQAKTAWENATADMNRLRGITEAVALLERAKAALGEVKLG